MSLVQMLGVYMWLEHFHSLSDALYLTGSGRGWGNRVLSKLEACLHRAECEACSADRAARWGFKRLILAMSWLVKCAEIIRDSGQRVSCGGGGRHTRLAHMSTAS